MIFIKKRPSKDRCIDDIYEILNILGKYASFTSATSSGLQIVTDIGGIACQFYNSSGVYLNKGSLVRANDVSSLIGITLCTYNDFDCIGSVYKGIPPNSLGYVTTYGPCDVLFNANGSFARGYFQMSRNDDAFPATGNDDTGKAQCWNVGNPDTIAVLGYVFQTRTGEGLARCFIKR